MTLVGGSAIYDPHDHQRTIVDTNEEDDEHPSTMRYDIRVDTNPFASNKRHIQCYTFDQSSQQTGFVEVKIGGHALDHKRILHTHPTSLHGGPLKTLTYELSSARQSLSFASRQQRPLVYAPVKIGGHPLDHLRFLDRNRPLWGYASFPASPSSLPSHLIRPSNTNVDCVLDDSLHSMPHFYDCSHCMQPRKTPRVVLCCGHSVCARCLASDTIRHVSSSQHCVIECAQCLGLIAIEAVVFTNKVLHVPFTGARSLSDWKRQYPTKRLNWKYGSAVAALAILIRRLTYPQLSSPSNLTSTSSTEPIVDTCESIENGRTRWEQRLRGLHPPSKLLGFQYIRTLGKGNFAEVLLVRHPKGYLSVLKESDQLQEAVNEIRLLSKIDHPHVIKIHQYFIERIGHRTCAYIEMEYCEQGDLFQLIMSKSTPGNNRQNGLDPTQFDTIFRQVCLGLTEIHQCGIVHRDLKPGNILLTMEGLVKIADFGVSTYVGSEFVTHHAAGTLAYMAPEVRRYFLGEDVSYDAKADIWSLGVLAVAMLTGNPEPKVATCTVQEVIERLHMVEVVDKYLELVQHCLDPQPHHRPSLSELLELFPSMNARL